MHILFRKSALYAFSARILHERKHVYVLFMKKEGWKEKEEGFDIFACAFCAEKRKRHYHFLATHLLLFML